MQQPTIYFGGDTTSRLLRSLLKDHRIFMRLIFHPLTYIVCLRYEDYMLSSSLQILSACCHQCKELVWYPVEWSKGIIKLYRLNCGKELESHTKLREDSKDAVLSLPDEVNAPGIFCLLGRAKFLLDKLLRPRWQRLLLFVL